MVDPDGWAALEPWEDTVEIVRNGRVIYKGPVVRITYAAEYLEIRMPLHGGAEEELICDHN